ncbi:hypothetical protein ACQ4PT_038110 [Festuca glaucescens]
MVVVQMLFSVLNILIKLALNDGMDARVLVALPLHVRRRLPVPHRLLRREEHKATTNQEGRTTLVLVWAVRIYYKPEPVRAGHKVNFGNLCYSYRQPDTCSNLHSCDIDKAKVGEVYPCHYSIAAMVCLFGAIQSTIMAACVERDKEQWRLGLNIRLYSSAYAGLVASGFAFPLLSWCLRKKGLLFIAVFSPLMLIFVAVLSSILLNEALYLGSVLGSILIVGGLYLVLWGKAKEQAEVSKDDDMGRESIPMTATSEMK